LYQKAAKQQAARNAAILKRMHLVSGSINILYILLRFILFRSSATRNTYLLYFLLSAPAFAIELWFQNIGQPTHDSNGELRKAGEDLEAKGLTEFLFDIFWWTNGVVAIAAIFGNRAWWLWTVIPVYSAYLAFTTFTGLRQGMAGIASQSDDSASTSNRQKKLEKRGGQRIQYR
jgi:hypothetical protein